MNALIPSDLSKVKTKIIFGMTRRQLVCIGAALMFGLPLFFGLKHTVSTSAAMFCMILVMLPCFLFALYEKNGQPLEKVIQSIVITKYFRSPVRRYETDNLYSLIELQSIIYKEVDSYDKPYAETAHKYRKETH